MRGEVGLEETGRRLCRSDAAFAAGQPFAPGASVAVRDADVRRTCVDRKGRGGVAMSTTPSATEPMRPKPPIDIAFIVASPQ